MKIAESNLSFNLNLLKLEFVCIYLDYTALK